MSKYYIVNEVDRPCERRSDSRIALLAVQVDKSKAIYRTGAGGVRR